MLGLPARYVSGYILAGQDNDSHVASHAWAEVFIDGLGWVSFDPTNRQSATEEYVRLAIGFDYPSAAPIRGSRYGGGMEEMTVRVQLEQNSKLINHLAPQMSSLIKPRITFLGDACSQTRIMCNDIPSQSLRMTSRTGTLMTYCLGIRLNEGLVFAADSRTNAGVDNISKFRKLFVFENPGERIICVLTAGNLAITQAVISQLEEGLDGGTEDDTLYKVDSLSAAAKMVGDALRNVRARARRHI